MGERNDIRLRNDNIYLYSHSDTVEELKAIIKQALIRGKERWDDRTYLNRIIFSEMIQNDVLELTGYGLSNGGEGNIVIDVDNQTVDGISFDKFIGGDEEWY